MGVHYVHISYLSLINISVEHIYLCENLVTTP